MEMDATESKIIWLDLNNKGYPWWPCKVEDEGYVSFQDNCRYELSEVKPSKVRSYNCKELASMIAKGKKKLRRKRTTLSLYLDAINEAVKLIQSTIDSKFNLNFDSKVSLQSLADISICSSRKGDMVSVTHDSSFTATSENCLGEVGSYFSDFSPHPVFPTSQERSHHGNVLGQNNGLEPEARRSSSCVSKKKKGNVRASRRLDYQDNDCIHDSFRKVPRHTCAPKRTHTPLSKGIHPPSPKRTHKNGRRQYKQRGRPSYSREPKSASFTPSRIMHTTSPSRVKYTPSSVSLTTPLSRVINKPTSMALTIPHCSSMPQLVEHNTATLPIAPVSTETTAAISSIDSSPSSSTSSPQATPDATPTIIRPHLFGRLGGVCSNDSEEEEEVGRLFSDSDDDLPSVDLNVKECAKIHELKPNNVIWAKVGKYPFWPALISHVTSRKSKSSVFVYFFGYNDDSPYRISQSQNVALFATKHFQDYTADGKLCKEQDRFEQALKEARGFVREKAEGTYDTRTPRELFREAVALRPFDYDSATRARVPDSSEGEEAEEGESEEAGSKVMTNDSENESSDGEVEEEEEEEGSLYTYDRVCKEIKLLQPVLVGIVKEHIPSTHHKVFKYGSTKERNQLKVAHKCGPIRRWNSNKVTHLLEECLLEMASMEGFGIAYALDVLLPEAMVRVKAKVEDISIEQALEQFQA